MSRTVHPPYDTETMLRILRNDRELPRTTRVEFRGITINGIKTVADLLSKFRLAGQFRLKVDKDADPRFSVVWPAPGSEDTELGVLMELEVGHGETEVYSRVQA